MSKMSAVMHGLLKDKARRSKNGAETNKRK